MANDPLIPREVLFGNPRRAQARLSHDGKWISFQAPVNGVLNIWVAPADDLSKAKAVTEEKVRPIPSHDWAYDNKHILYIQDKNGDENFHLYATDVVTGETKDLTPIDGVRAEIAGSQPEVSQRDPRRPQRSRQALPRHLADQHRNGREETRAAKPRHRRLS